MTVVRSKEKLRTELNKRGANASDLNMNNVVQGIATDPNKVRQVLRAGINVIIFGVGGFQVGVKLGEENSWTAAPEQQRGFIEDPHVCENSAKVLCEVLATSFGFHPEPRLVAIGNIGFEVSNNFFGGGKAIRQFKPYAWFTGYHDRRKAGNSPIDNAYADKAAMEATFRENEVLFNSCLFLRPAFLVDDPSDSVPPLVGLVSRQNPVLKPTVSREVVGRWLYDNCIRNPLLAGIRIRTISRGGD